LPFKALRKYDILECSIDLFEGRTLEQKKALAKEVTEAVVRNTGAPQSAVHVIINDMPEGTYFPQGEIRTK
jgi:4-oxalocrotonate tautomerase